MAILADRLYVVGIVVVVFLQLEGSQTVPNHSANISGLVTNEKKADKSSNNMAAVNFINSCNNQELYYSIANNLGGCYNIRLNNVQQVIKTEPGNVKLYLYDESQCSGERIEYDSSSQLNMNLPFLPVSFAIATL